MFYKLPSLDKANRFLFAVCVSLVLAFIFSCSSDGGDNSFSVSNSSSGISSTDVKLSSSSSLENPEVSSSSEDVPIGCSIDGYRTVKIGTQTWMAENLNCEVSGSVCYDNDLANCAKYGRLYDWATAMKIDSSCNSNSCASQIQFKHRGICPSGWHIPSDAEWDQLYSYVVDDASTCENFADYGYCPTVGGHLKAKAGWNDNGNGLDTYYFSALPSGFGYFGDSFYDVGYSSAWWYSYEYADNYAYSRLIQYHNDFAFWRYYDKSRLLPIRCLRD